MKPVPVSLAEVRRRSIKSRAFHSVHAGQIEFVKVNTNAWRWRDVYPGRLGFGYCGHNLPGSRARCISRSIFFSPRFIVSSKTVLLAAPEAIGFLIAS